MKALVLQFCSGPGRPLTATAVKASSTPRRRSWQPYRKDHHRRDLFIGLGVSVLLHLGLLFGEKWWGTTRPATVEEPEVVPQMQLVSWPTEEPETPDPAEGNLGEWTATSFAPPRQMEPPRMVALDPSLFVMPATRVLPTGMDVANRITTIPTLSGNWRGEAGQRFGGIFELSDLDQPPETRSQPLPHYPVELQRSGITGEVLVGFIVTAQGQVERLTILRSSRTEFEQPALTAVAQWRFRPGRKSGRAVATRMEVPIAFSLNPVR